MLITIHIADLYDVTGRLIRNYKLQPGNFNILQADGLAVGIYIVKVFGGDLSKSQKVILE